MDDYSTQLKSGAHWSLRVRRGVQLSLVNTTGNVNVGMVFFNSDNLAERYNAPDTLKAQDYQRALFVFRYGPYLRLCG